MGDTLSGSWATLAVLCEKGNPRTRSAGRSYCIWKFDCFNETVTSTFLFGFSLCKALDFLHLRYCFYIYIHIYVVLLVETKFLKSNGESCFTHS